MDRKGEKEDGAGVTDKKMYCPKDAQYVTIYELYTCIYTVKSTQVYK